MKMKYIFLSIFSVVCCLNSANANIPPFSKYGQIQNVQTYSSNPFFNPNSPYNQKLSKPIYAQGTELNAGECRKVVYSIIAGQCALRNNCDGLSYYDISPAVTVQLSNMTGHNYVASCSGYIQQAFEDYKKNTFSVPNTGFPTANTLTDQQSSTLVLNNPFELKSPAWVARQQELRDLQRQTGAEDVKIQATRFPATYADLSFTERMANEKAGYEPWKDSKAYQSITLEDEEQRLMREKDEAAARANLIAEQEKMLKITDYCKWCYNNNIKCYEDLAKKLNDLNKGRKDNACARKSPGVNIDCTLWDVISDVDCGWILKEDARTIVLTDADCGTVNPINTTPGDSDDKTDPLDGIPIFDLTKK
ncbi:MAG: hypothetical protein ACOX7D_01730 [Alphaproteobacteria bacterium]|jgi:hypothetical protein